MIRNRNREATGAKSGMTLIWGLILLEEMEGLSKIFTDECVVLDMKIFEKSLVTHGLNESRGGESLKCSPFGRLL